MPQYFKPLKVSIFLLRNTVPITGVLMAGAIAINALYGQTGPHPAPIAQSPRQVDTLVGGDLATVPMPPSRIEDPIAAKLADRVTDTILPPAQSPISAGVPRAVSTDEIATRLLSADLDIAEIQAGLQSLGLYSGVVDGLMGPQTQGALEAYVAREAITVDGSLINAVGGHLKIRAKGEPSSHLKQSTSIQHSSGRDEIDEILKLSNAHSDPMVHAVQRVLADYGYAPGRVDGVLSAETQNAIRQFERDRDLPQTGTVSRALLRELEAFTGKPVV